MPPPVRSKTVQFDPPVQRLAFRADQVRPSMGSAAVLQNAPETEGGCFKVEKVIDG